MTQSLTHEQGRQLLLLARKIITQHAGDTYTGPEPNIRHDIFQLKSGTFVTLEKQGNLRGCIGSLSSHATIEKSIMDNAKLAGFQDHRFPAVSAEELDDIIIEVSILTPPKDLVYEDSNDLLQQLRPGKDGVILSKNLAGATFLPQVWEQLPKPEIFLSHLCLKAGLPEDAWTKPGMTIQTYQVQKFSEKDGFFVD